jgi:hypothetical protein
MDAVVPQHSRRGLREGSSELLSALAGLSKNAAGGAHGGIHGGSVPLMGYMPGLESDNLLRPSSRRVVTRRSTLVTHSNTLVSRSNAWQPTTT